MRKWKVGKGIAWFVTTDGIKHMPGEIVELPDDFNPNIVDMVELKSPKKPVIPKPEPLKEPKPVASTEKAKRLDK